MTLSRESLRSPAGRAQANEELRRVLRGSLARAFGATFSDADLDDLTQESLTRVHANLDRFDGRSRLTTWATSIAVNLALMEKRRRKFEHITLDDAAESGRALFTPARGSQDAQRSELIEMLRDGIEVALTEKQKSAIYAELTGMPMSEVALRMGTTRGALYKVLHDGRRRLRSYLLERGVSAADLALEEM